MDNINMSMLPSRTSILAVTLTTLYLTATAASPPHQLLASWQTDFDHQPVTTRPALEVRYTDATRTAFQILAEDYQLLGQLKKPHLLLADQAQPWLWMEMVDRQGDIYSTRFSDKPSRINLYRRGPYYCEVHWFDLQPTTQNGTAAPVKGDLTLFCYPEKILAEITWHGTGKFDAKQLRLRGVAPHTFTCKPFQNGVKQSFSSALFGEPEPLSDDAFTLHVGKAGVQYDPQKGCYVVGTVTSNSFQKHFYEHPNRYETASFTIKNDAVARKIYICHESVVGGAIVEGGVVLDQQGHPLPIVVQVSKNFAGEKEEKFYNPRDIPFSETFFPLYLEPHEQLTLTSLHLYQNWGRHMTKHWSSLGAWMDYFHSSTGVTETTCYVPFKFGGIGGVAIADFRAMSQETFWANQPQHDNLAGHGFLSFFDGQRWQHSKYLGTTYRSTGPNWFDIQLKYISTDGSIAVTADIWETPQADELRSFFDVRYEVLKPVTIDDAQADFRFLSVTSAIQGLRFTRFAANDIDDLKIDFSQSPFPVKGAALPSQNAYLAEYGDHTKNRGSNAIVIRQFTGPRRIGPAASLQTGSYKNRSPRDQPQDTRLLLVPNVDKLELRPGDQFQINGFWLPYGNGDNAQTPRRETITYGQDGPRVTACETGTVVTHLPIRVRADNNVAKFSIAGGQDLLPVIVTGLTTWKYPRIWKQEHHDWRLLSHARNHAHDGYQVFCNDDGTFGAVFLVASDPREQTLKVSVGQPVPEGAKIVLNPSSGSSAKGNPPKVGFRNPDPVAATEMLLSFPQTERPSAFAGDQTMVWQSSEGSSLWFQLDEAAWQRGGRISPNQDHLELEYWWQHAGQPAHDTDPTFLIDLTQTPFADPQGDRTWILTAKGWQQANLQNQQANRASGVIAVQSADSQQILCLAWPNSSGSLAIGGKQIGVSLQQISFPSKRRYHLRGKLYLIDNDLEVLRDRIRKEMPEA